MDSLNSTDRNDSCFIHFTLMSTFDVSFFVLSARFTYNTQLRLCQLAFGQLLFFCLMSRQSNHNTEKFSKFCFE